MLLIEPGQRPSVARRHRRHRELQTGVAQGDDHAHRRPQVRPSLLRDGAPPAAAQLCDRDEPPATPGFGGDPVMIAESHRQVIQLDGRHPPMPRQDRDDVALRDAPGRRLHRRMLSQAVRHRAMEFWRAAGRADHGRTRNGLQFRTLRTATITTKIAAQIGGSRAPQTAPLSPNVTIAADAARPSLGCENGARKLGMTDPGRPPPAAMTEPTVRHCSATARNAA